MSENVVVRARIDEKIKEEASAVLASMGLTVSSAFRIMLTRVANEKTLPFDLVSKKEGFPVSGNVPNETTVKAIQDKNYETVSLDELKDMCQ